MKRILCFSVVALFALTVPAMAAIGEGNSEIGFDYGSTDYDSDTGIDTSDSLSLRGGYFVNRMFEVEGQYVTADQDTDVSGTNVETSMDLIMVNGVFNFHPRPEIVPYVLVGFGRSDIEVDMPGINASDSGMAYQFGAGTRFFFGKTKRAAFRMDISFISEDSFDESSTHTTIAGGFTFRLGNN